MGGRRLAVHVLDTRIEIVLHGRDTDELFARAEEAWSLALAPTTDVDAVVVAELLPEGGQRHHRTVGWEPKPGKPWAFAEPDPGRLLMLLTQYVTSAAIKEQSGRLLMLHAAGLAHPQTGKASIWVAPGNMGKSTLVRTLGPSFSYLTDETIAIRRDGTIAPYAKPVSTRVEEAAGVKEERAPGPLGLSLPAVAARPAGLVFLDRVAAHEGPAQIAELDTLSAVEAAVPESSAFMVTDKPLQWLAHILELTGGARRVRYSEASDLLPLAREIMEEVP